MRRALRLVLAALTLMTSEAAIEAQSPAFTAADFDRVIEPSRPLVLGAELVYVGASLSIRQQGPVRWSRAGRPLVARAGVLRIARGDVLAPVMEGLSDGVRASAGSDLRSFRIEEVRGRGSLEGSVATIALSNAEGAAGACPYVPALDALPAARPDDARRSETSATLDATTDPASILRYDLGANASRARLRVLTKSDAERANRVLESSTGEFRLVSAPSLRPVEDRETLLVRLDDRIVIEAEVNGVLRAQIPIGIGRCEKRIARIALHQIRPDPGAPEPAGETRASAASTIAAMLDDTDALLGACGISLEVESGTPMNPPVAGVLAVADGDGFDTLDEARIALSVEGRALRLRVPRSSSPVETAERIASAIEGAGFLASVRALPPLGAAAGASADVVVRRRNGELARLAPVEGEALSSDRRQRLRIGRVDFSDGLESMDGDDAATGTLEERALLSAIFDETEADERNIVVVIVDRFSDASRMGEAFVERDLGPWSGAVVLTRESLANHAEILTLPHELAHLFLNDPFHASSPSIGAFNRILAGRGRLGSSAPSTFVREECERMRAHGSRYFSATSGTDAAAN